MAWIAPVAIAIGQQMSGANQRRNAASQSVLDQNKQNAAAKMGTYQSSADKALEQLAGAQKTDMNMSEALGSSVKPRDWDPDVPRDDPQMTPSDRPVYGNAISASAQKPMSEVLNPYSKPPQQDVALQGAMGGPQQPAQQPAAQQGPSMSSRINQGVGYGQMASGMIQQAQQARDAQNQAMMARNMGASANKQYTPTADLLMQDALRARRGY